MDPLFFQAASSPLCSLRPPLWSLWTVFLFVPLAHALPSVEPIVVYVSPAGSDRWSGTLDAPNAGKTDGPLASPGAAVEKLRSLRRAGTIAPATPMRIVLRAGTYRLDKPLVLTPEDSGEPGAPVTIEAQANETPIISGGAPLGPWREAEVDGKKLWAADVPVTAPGQDTTVTVPWVFRELFMSGKRRTRARHPNSGYLQIQDVPGLPPDAPWTEGKDFLRFRPADAPAWGAGGVGGAGIVGADAVVMTRWIDNHLTIASIDAGERTADFTRRAVFLLNNDDLYYLEGATSLLDAPGEWCLDRAKNVVYYQRIPGEDPAAPSTATARDALHAVAPVLTCLLRITGEPENGRFVHDVEFRGITFSHAQWWFTDGAGRPAPEWSPVWPGADVCGFQQAAWGLPGAIVAQGARRVVFDGCTVSHVGGYGIELGRACRDCRIAGCTLTDLGGGGVKIGEPTIRQGDDERTDHNQLTDSSILGAGRIHHQAVGVWIGQSEGNLIAHNRIAELDYSGISIGWTWGYGPSAAGGNIVEFNDVGWLGAHPGTTPGDPPLGDMGGIYTLGTQPGTIIRNNFFHDIAGRTIAWGIYFDEGSTGIVAENNIVSRTTHGGFHQHYGRDNIVRNNILFQGRDSQLQKSRREDHTAFTFSGNIVAWRSAREGGTLLAGDWGGNDFQMSSNLYFNSGGNVQFPGGRTLEQWQAGDGGKEGHDAGSIVADPMFIDTERDDFRMHDGSPALKMGFKPIDTGSIGPRARKP